MFVGCSAYFGDWFMEDGQSIKTGRADSFTTSFRFLNIERVYTWTCLSTSIHPIRIQHSSEQPLPNDEPTVARRANDARVRAIDDQ